ncbi:TPA: hypothetical protein ACH3X3_009782 [Trebouxia sp. C0006]
MAHATAGKVFSEKSNRLQELDLAMTGTQSSSLSCDTMPLGHAAYPRYPFDRSSSVCSTAGTLTRPVAHAQGASHGVPSQTMRASSQGSKRSFDVSGEEEDTPTKRAKELSDSQQDEYAWGQSPVLARLRTRFSSECEQAECQQPDSQSLSDDLLASGHSSTSYADLCCGESDVFQDRQSFHTSSTDHSRRTWERSDAGQLQRTRSEPAPHSSCTAVSEDETILKEMIRNLYETELSLLADPDYMQNHGADHQPKNYIDQSMRMIVISWLVEVACEYELHQETLFLAAALLDRYMSLAKAVSRSNLQLISVACMLVAAKHEEERHPSVQDFTSIADNCFLAGDLLKMESVVLQSLAFRINAPTSCTFLSMFQQGINLSPKAHAMATFFTELALLEYAVLNFPPSVVAAASVLLAQSYDNLFTAAPHLQRLSGYTPQLLGCCMEELLDLQHRAFETNDLNSPFLAVKDKYRDCKWHCVSTITPHSHLPEQIYQSTGPAAAGKADRLKCQ